MTLFVIMVPLMVLAIAVAIGPVLYFSIREHRLIHAGSAGKLQSVRLRPTFFTRDGIPIAA